MASINLLSVILILHFLTSSISSESATRKISRDRNQRLYRVVCEHVAWSFYRPGHGKFGVEDIDPHLCTHLIYGYAGIHNNRIRPLDGALDLEGDYGKGNYKKFNELRESNPRLTTLLAVGGWNEGSIKFSEMAKDPSKRKVFVQSALDILRMYDFDGLNVDWQFPANRGGVPEDRDRFTRLLQDLREALDPEGFLLTTTVASRKETIDSAYDVRKIGQIVDFLNVLSYDYHRGGDAKTALSAPLYPGNKDGQKELSVDFTIRLWQEKGAPFDKLVLGINAYAQSLTLTSAGSNSLGQNVTGPGEPGPYTREAGILGYNELCEYLGEGDWKVTWQQEQRGSYASKGNQWVTFDDTRSVTEKAQYAKNLHLGGVLLHGIESDDARGLCGGQEFSLLTSAYKVLHGEERPVIASTRPPVTTTSSGPTVSTSTRPSVTFVCPHTGFFRDPLDCTRYFQCIRTGWSGKFSIIEFRCGAGTAFDQKNTVCTWKNLVPECN